MKTTTRKSLLHVLCIATTGHDTFDVVPFAVTARGPLDNITSHFAGSARETGPTSPAPEILFRPR